MTDLELHAYYCKSNDVAVVSEIYQRYSHIVFGICLKYLGNRDDAKDITLEVFSDMLEKWKMSEVKNTPAWLHVISKNKCLNLLQRQKRFSIYVQSQQQENEIFEDENNVVEELIQEMGNAIEALPRAQRTCIEKFYLQKMSYKEIADLLKIPIGEVRSNIQNGRRNIRLQMKKVI